MKFALVLLLLSSLLLSSPVPSTASSPEEVKWSAVNIPAEGKAGSWVIANGSDISCLTAASDGTLYCCANPAGTSYHLFKSTDGGCTWSYTGKVEDTIVAIAVMPGKPNIVYYATSSKVCKSIDAGASFTLAALNPTGTGSGNLAITSLDVNTIGSGNIIAIGTRDNDAAQFGGVFLLEESRSAAWVDTRLAGYDVCGLAFSPKYTQDRQLVAVATNEINTIITTSVNASMWNSTIGDAVIAGTVAVSAEIAFPSDYTSEAAGNKYVQFVAINTGTGGGDVFRIEGRLSPSLSKITDLNAGATYNLNSLDIYGMAVAGNGEKALIIAGAAASAQVYTSPDSGKSWARSNKPPTGGGKTFVLMANDFSQSGTAYAATSGAESAFSISRDRGLTWNQLSLMDTRVTAIVDLAVSPLYATDNTVFLLTFGIKHSLWRSTDGAIRWERVYSGALAGVDGFNLVSLSPQPTSFHTIFIAGTSGGKPVFWRSTDNGQNFIFFNSADPKTGAPLNIDTWAIASDNSLFVGSYDGTNGVVCRNSGGAPFYSEKAAAGTAPLHSLAVSPDFSQDRTVLTGNTTGWVYLSDDTGTSFQPLPPGAVTAPLGGSVTVAFDPDYPRNRTVYAASDTADKGIFRFIVDKSTGWERMDAAMPAGAKITSLAVSADGTFYAGNSQPVDTTAKKGGIERSLDPDYSLGPSFETVTRGLVNGAVLTELQVSGSRLWSIDSANLTLITYIDTMAQSVTLGSPADKSPGMNTSNVDLKWKTLPGATKYRWQIDRDTDFSSIPAGFEGDSEGSSAGLPALEPNTTYYWRVRATEPVLSAWSNKWSFSTSLSTEVAAPRLITPEPAANKVSLKPIFQWRAMSGADRYEFLLSADPSFASPLVSRTGEDSLSATAYQCDIALKQDTTYYWKVRAVNGSTASEWSSVGAFSTEPPPPPPAPQSPSPSVLPSQAVSPSPPPQPSPTPIVIATMPQAPQQQSPDSTMMLIYVGMSVLLVLLIILVILVIIMLKVFRRQY